MENKNTNVAQILKQKELDFSFPESQENLVSNKTLLESKEMGEEEKEEYK